MKLFYSDRHQLVLYQCRSALSIGSLTYCSRVMTSPLPVFQTGSSTVPCPSAMGSAIQCPRACMKSVAAAMAALVSWMDMNVTSGVLPAGRARRFLLKECNYHLRPSST